MHRGVREGRSRIFHQVPPRALRRGSQRPCNCEGRRAGADGIRREAGPSPRGPQGGAEHDDEPTDRTREVRARARPARLGGRPHGPGDRRPARAARDRVDGDGGRGGRGARRTPPRVHPRRLRARPRAATGRLERTRSATWPRPRVGPNAAPRRVPGNLAGIRGSAGRPGPTGAIASRHGRWGSAARRRNSNIRDERPAIGTQNDARARTRWGGRGPPPLPWCSRKGRRNGS